MEKLKDFDVTQIDKDTKVVVFRVPFSLFMESENGMDKANDYCNNIGSKLNKVGIKALFIDESTKVEPLTDELLLSGRLKSL